MGQEAVDGFEYGSDTEASEQTQICQDLSSGLSEPTSSLKLSHACSFQLNLGRYAQSSSLVKSHEIQQSISKLSNSHIESITIMSRTEGKIEELSKITKGVQLAFQELAGRIANRVQESRLEDQQYVQHIEKTLQKLFSEHISGAVAKPSSEISIHNIAVRGTCTKQFTIRTRSKAGQLHEAAAQWHTGGAGWWQGYTGYRESFKLQDMARGGLHEDSRYDLYLGERNCAFDIPVIHQIIQGTDNFSNNHDKDRRSSITHNLEPISRRSYQMPPNLRILDENIGSFFRNSEFQ